MFVIGDEIDHYHDLILVTGIKQSALINDASRTPLAYAASECAIEDGHRGAGGGGQSERLAVKRSIPEHYVKSMTHI